MNHPVIQSAAKEPVNQPVILSVSEGSRMATLNVLFTGFFSHETSVEMCAAGTH